MGGGGGVGVKSILLTPNLHPRFKCCKNGKKKKKKKKKKDLLARIQDWLK